MSFWKSLFGGGAEGAGKPGTPPAAAAEEEYKGFVIRATPTPVGSEFQLAGIIEKELGGTMQSYSFVRADRLSSRDEAARFAIAKGRLIVDEQGDRMFAQSGPSAQ